MVTDRELRTWFPPLVKEYRYIPQSPGFILIYFKNFRELNAYFIEHYGENWRQEEWAIEWFRAFSKYKKRRQREIANAHEELTTKTAPMKTIPDNSQKLLDELLEREYQRRGILHKKVEE